MCRISGTCADKFAYEDIQMFCQNCIYYPDSEITSQHHNASPGIQCLIMQQCVNVRSINIVIFASSPDVQLKVESHYSVWADVDQCMTLRWAPLMKVGKR